MIDLRRDQLPEVQLLTFLSNLMQVPIDRREVFATEFWLSLQDILVDALRRFSKGQGAAGDVCDVCGKTHVL
jgi:hypothetical protein